jgi:hypothetical protein
VRKFDIINFPLLKTNPLDRVRTLRVYEHISDRLKADGKDNGFSYARSGVGERRKLGGKSALRVRRPSATKHGLEDFSSMLAWQFRLQLF